MMIKTVVIVLCALIALAAIGVELALDWNPHHSPVRSWIRQWAPRVRPGEPTSWARELVRKVLFLIGAAAILTAALTSIYWPK
mgnify:CR=1 FL=1